MRIACALAVLVAAASVTSRAQQPTFRAETVLVEVHAVVTDGTGAIVRGLTREDFTILQDGAPQPIAEFAFVNLPYAAPAPMPLSAVRPAPATVINTAPPRAFMLVVDDVLAPPGDRERTRLAARQFLMDHLAEGDAAAVSYTSGRRDLEQPFTVDRAALLRAIDGASGVTPYIPPGATQRRVVDTLGRTAAWMDQVMPGRRKVLLYFGAEVPGLAAVVEAAPTQEALAPSLDADSPRPDELVNTGNEMLQRDDARRLIDTLRTANVAVYPINATGLASLFGQGDGAEASGGSTRDPSAGAFGRANSLRAAAEATGGVALVNSNNLPEYFARIVRESGSYYVLGYAPTEGAPGTPRSLSVRVGRPGVLVRARRSVVLPAAPPPRSGGEQAMAMLNAALDSPLPMSGVPMRLSTNAAARGGRELSIRIELPGAFAATPGQPAIVDLAMAVLGDGKVVHSHVERANGATMEQRVTLPGGRYQVRVAALDRVSGRIGSVLAEVTIPGR